MSSEKIIIIFSYLSHPPTLGGGVLPQRAVGWLSAPADQWERIIMGGGERLEKDSSGQNQSFYFKALIFWDKVKALLGFEN
jgi:hypothetical protein